MPLKWENDECLCAYYVFSLNDKNQIILILTEKFEFFIQAWRSGVVPSITDGNPLHDPLHQAQRRRRQGRVHEVAVHDHTPLGRIPEGKMDP